MCLSNLRGFPPTILPEVLHQAITHAYILALCPSPLTELASVNSPLESLSIVERNITHLQQGIC